MKAKLFFMLISIAACCFCSCGDDGDNANIGVDKGDDRSPADYLMSPEVLADYAMKNFIYNVCETEIDSTTLELKSWEVNYGKVLYAVTPSVRYKCEESREAARENFLSMICHEAAIDSSQVNGTMTVDMGSHGYVRYVAEERNGEWGHIDVNLKKLPDLTKIVFVKPEAWPENFVSNNRCGINNYDVFETWWGKGHVYYTCVKNSSKDGVGVLVAFDTWVDGTLSSSEHIYRGRNCHDVLDNAGNIDSRVIENMREFLYKQDKGKQENAVKVLKFIDANQERYGGATLSETLYKETVFFIGGTGFCRMDEHDPWYYKGHWHFIATPYTVMTPTKVTSKILCYECDCVDPGAFSESDPPHVYDNDSEDHKWGDSEAFRKYGTSWISKFWQWYSYLRIDVIKYDGSKSREEIMERYRLKQVNLGI